MNLIKDIRLFESAVPNVNGNSTPYYIGKIFAYDHMDCLDVIQRLLFRLRDRGFGFEGFDHLYVNFTTCLPHGEVQDVNRYTIREFAWHHYVDVGCDCALFNSWKTQEKTAFILEHIRKAALLKTSEDQRQVFCDTFDEVMQKGESLLIPYRRKEKDGLQVEILLRINDELDFLPLIRVTDKTGTVLAQKELRSYGRDEFILQISTITIGKRSVRIVPRKNWDAEYYELKPIKLEW